MKQQRCPNCDTLNPPSTTRCLHCDESLDATMTVRDKAVREQMLQAAKTKTLNPEDVDNVETRPPAFDASAYETGSEHKEDISTRRVEADREPDKEIRIGTVRLKGDLVLTELQTETEFKILQVYLDEVVIGRRDKDANFKPTVDVTELNGHKLGVSRRHASIRWENGLLVIVDHNSRNGTFLNGKRIVPEQARILRNNDIVSVGLMKFKLSYRKS